MTAGAIISMVVMALIFLVAILFSISRMGKGGKWED